MESKFSAKWTSYIDIRGHTHMCLSWGIPEIIHELFLHDANNVLEGFQNT